MTCKTDFATEFENFRKRFVELEEKSKKDEMRFLMLEIEVENLKKKNHELEEKITSVQNVTVDNDCEILNDLMIENKVLECEKQKVETELCICKERVKELESNMKGKNEKVKEEVDKFKEVCHNKDKTMAPSSPCVARSPFYGIIDVSDEDLSCNEIPKATTASGSRKRDNLGKCQSSSKGNIQNTNLQHIDEEHMDDEFQFRSSNTIRAKRKRSAKIVTSDDDSSYDDNAPICSLKKQDSFTMETTSDDSEVEVKENASRRNLTSLRRLESKSSEDDEGGDESDGEGESLGGFIVNTSESDDESEDALNEYKETLDMIGRKKVSNYKWDLEGEMLSDFGKDPVLCMRAVCALYRQQTVDEKASKVTIHQNERGFSQPDAPRASELAEFLTDGVPNGDLNKTVEELKEYDSKGIKLCMNLAAKYSKQLFEIYQNKEDPYFMPP